jgi:PAS domain S-box-containing protein
MTPKPTYEELENKVSRLEKELVQHEQSEHKLGSLNDFLNAVLNRIADPICVRNKNHYWVLANDRFCEISGVTREALLGKSDYDFFPKEEADVFWKMDNKVLSFGKENFSDEYLTNSSTGETIFLNTKKSLYENEKGEQFVIAIGRDLTGYKKAQDALKFERLQLLSIFNSLKQSIYITDPKTYEVLYVNDTLKDIFGKDSVGGLCYKEFQGLDSPCEFCTNEIILEKKYEPYQWEYHNPVLNRDYMIIDKIIKWPDARDVRLEVAIDITELKRSEEALRASEETARALLNAPTDTCILIDSQMIILSLNEIAAKSIGKSADELIGTDLFHHFSSPINEFRKAHAAQVFRTGEPFRLIDEREGRYYDNHYYPVYNNEGKVERIAIFIRDITDQKFAEESLRKERDFNRTLIQASPAFFIAIGADGKTIMMNDAMLNAMGYSADEVVGADYLTSFVPEGDRAILSDIFKTLINNHEPTFNKNRVLTKDGRELLVEWHGRPIFRENGDFDYFFGLGIDITERKHAEKALSESEERFRELAELLPETVYEMDAKGNLIYVNHRALHQFQYEQKDFDDGLDAFKMIVPEQRDRARENARKILSGEKIGLNEFAGLRKDGSTFPMLVNSAPITRKGRPVGLRGCLIDITNLKKIEEALRKSEESYRTVVEDMPAMICCFLHDGTLTFANSSYYDCFQKTKEDLIGKSFFQFIPEHDREKVRNHFISLDQKMPMISYEHQIITPDGRVKWQEWTDRALFDESGRVVEYQSIGRDITEIKLAQEEKARIEKQLMQAQKMESIGTLAGGIAHDFNNILASVLGFTELAINKVKEADHNVLDDLEIVFQAGHRAKDLVHQILQFSRHADIDFKPVGIGPIVKEVLKFLKASLPTTIEIKQKIQPITEKVLADGSQIHQVVMNLCTNAFHAMQKQGGVLTVELFKQELKTPILCQGSQITPGTYAVLMIKDTGYGMDNEKLQRIFEPYFTTKSINEGTGLGLAVTKGIVTSSKGGICVESTPEVGSVFTLYFPLITMPEEAQTSELPPIKGGTDSILFVDDEEFFVDFGAKVFAGLGYDVITANESLKALEIFTSQPDRFDLVVTDQTMPKMTGLELCRKLHAIRPNLPIIICTGFSEIINSKTAKQIGVSHILFKPATRRDLATAVRKVLDNG